MKPSNIILIRHGQSEGNINKDVYKQTPDYALNLTSQGREQAKVAGEKILAYLREEGFSYLHPMQFYISPFWRTRQTYQEIVKSFPKSFVYEDPRLREQEYGHLRSQNVTEKIEQERDAYGHFYYRMPDGESAADVFDRASDFLNTLHRDFEKIDYPKNVIIVNHGMTLRVLLMRWLHWSVEEFELLANPHNCEFFILKLNIKTQKYELKTEFRKHKSHNHPYQFQW